MAATCMAPDQVPSIPRTMCRGPVLNEDWARAAKEERRMDQPAYHLDQTRRDAVLQVIQEYVAHSGAEARRD